MEMMRPPVPVGDGVAPSDLWFEAEATMCGRAGLLGLYVPSTSMSITDLHPFVDSYDVGARKLPAPPQLEGRKCSVSERRFGLLLVLWRVASCGSYVHAYNRKSIPPKSFTHLSIAFC